MRNEQDAYRDEVFSDKVNDIIHDYEHGQGFQQWVWAIMLELQGHIKDIESLVRNATDNEWWQYDGDLKGLYSAIKAFYDEPIRGIQNGKATTTTDDAATSGQA